MLFQEGYNNIFRPTCSLAMGLYQHRIKFPFPGVWLVSVSCPTDKMWQK